MTDPNNNNSNSGAPRSTGGIAWSGSLVGAANPQNLGYRYSTATKRYKRSAHGATGDGSNPDANNLPSSLVVQFNNRDGDSVGNQVDLPIGSDCDDMGLLVHALLHPDDDSDDNDDDDDKKKKKKKKEQQLRTPYTFYTKIQRDDGTTDEIELTSTLAALIQSEAVSTEDVLQLTYHPLAAYRVRPVTRCTDTLPGHTEAILHVSYSPDGRHLASGGGDTTVRFWDVNTSTPKHTCAAHRDHVLGTAWSPDGKRFASADKRGVLILWDPQTGRALATIQALSLIHI